MADWFSVNVADAVAVRHETSGTFVPFESRERPFPHFGINIHVLMPGQPNGRYHRENQQEDFLVLAGECIGIIDGAEHRFRAWDFIHCPPDTEHIFVGAGGGPCAILMVGARRDDEAIHYPVNELAARYGASVSAPTDDPKQAYADWSGDFQSTKLAWPPSS